MLLPARTLILVVFFYIGVILEFSDLAEQKWLQVFPIAYTEIVYGVIHLAWGPARMGFGWISDKMVQHYPDTWSLSHQMTFAVCFPIISWFLITGVLEDTDREWIVFLLCVAELGPVILLTVIEIAMVEYIRTEQEAISHSCRRNQLLGKAIGGYAGALLLHWTDTNTVFIIELLLLCGGFIFFASNVIYVTQSPSSSEPTNTRTTTTTTTVTGDRGSSGDIVTPPPPNNADVDIEGDVQVETPIGGDEAVGPVRLVLFMLMYSSIPFARNALFYYSIGPMNMDFASMGALKVCHIATTIGTTFMYSFATQQTSYRLVAMLGGWFVLVAMALRVILSMLIYIPDTFQFAAYALSVFCMSFGDGIIWTHYVTKCANMSIPKHRYTWLMALPTMGKTIRIALDSSIMLYYGVDHDHFNNIHITMFVCYAMSYVSLFSTYWMLR